VPEFYHVPAMEQVLVYSSTNFPNFSIIFPKFSHNVLDTAQTTTSFNCRYPLMCVHTSIDPMGVHLLHYAHGNERTGTHDAIHDIFVAIA